MTKERLEAIEMQADRASERELILEVRRLQDERVGLCADQAAKGDEITDLREVRDALKRTLSLTADAEDKLEKENEKLRAENEQLRKNVLTWMESTFEQNKKKIEAKVDRADMEAWGNDQLEYATRLKALLREARELLPNDNKVVTVQLRERIDAALGDKT